MLTLATGRWSGSCTIPRTSPKIVANNDNGSNKSADAPLRSGLQIIVYTFLLCWNLHPPAALTNPPPGVEPRFDTPPHHYPAHLINEAAEPGARTPLLFI